MRKLFIIPFLFFTASLNAAVIIRGPFVEDAEPTSAVIRWTTDTPSPAWIEYGPEGKCSQLMAISSKKINHAITLHGLIANTKFCYKIYVMNNAGTGVQEAKAGTFRTLFTPERKIVNFLVIGNSADPKGLAMEMKKQMAQSMKDYPADFLIHTGDIGAGGGIVKSDDDFFLPYRTVLTDAPLFPVLGEEEYGENRSTKEGKGFLAANFKKVHSVPWSKGTPNYYSIDTANARIVFIDTNNMYGALQAPAIDNKSNQYAWLRDTLAKAGANKWKIVVMHHPVYSSGESEDRLSQVLAPLFEAQKVNLVIQGHQGAYERTKPIYKGAESKGGPIYITVGGSGKFFEESSYENPWSSKYYALPHFVYISIVDRKLSLRTYTHENKRIDALDIYL